MTDISGKPLTLRQSEILEFFREYSAEQGRPPTIRGIGLRFGILSPNGVMTHLRALVRKGKLIHDGAATSGCFRLPRSQGRARVAIKDPVGVGTQEWDIEVVRMDYIDGRHVIVGRTPDGDDVSFPMADIVTWREAR